MTPRILIVDDEPDMLENYQRMLKRRGLTCYCTSSPDEAIGLLADEPFDLVITDLRMPGVDGVELVRRARKIDENAVVIVVTAFASVESAVAAVKEGAFDYLPKPFTYDQLVLVIERALEGRKLHDEVSVLRRRLEPFGREHKIVGQSERVTELLALTDRAAASDASVFIVGESGTGKELIARRIHAKSPRGSGPFVAVDCVSLPRDLIESELFGSEKGAFTSSSATRPGLFECANQGTLFLDEICELETDLQAKMLRVLQERQFRRVGGRRLISMDVRIVAATNRTPQQAVMDGKLREDLLYRLDVVRITVPALRDRDGDVKLLLEHFLQELSAIHGLERPTFTEESIAVIEQYPWPGNVRELRNFVEQLVLLAPRQEIELGDLPRRMIQNSHVNMDVQPDDSSSYKSARKKWIAQFERRYFERLLRRFDGNISRAAEEAGIDRKTLYRIMREHHLS